MGFWEMVTCSGCWTDFRVGEAHDGGTCRARAAARQAGAEAYLAGLPCCGALGGHGHKGCRSSVLRLVLDPPRRDCSRYCAACVPPMRPTSQEEAVAQAICLSMQPGRGPWESTDRQGQDVYRNAAKAALGAASAFAPA